MLVITDAGAIGTHVVPRGRSRVPKMSGRNEIGLGFILGRLKSEDLQYSTVYVSCAKLPGRESG